MAPSIVILAAGKGSRMGSSTPKALQKLANKPMLLHLLDNLKLIKPQQIIIVVGYQHELIRAACKNYAVEFAMQEQQYGTGHAALVAMPLVTSDKVVVLNADLPLISRQTMENLIATLKQHQCALLTANVDNPYGFGRIVRKEGAIAHIIEQTDATSAQLAINEINVGMYGFHTTFLKKHLQLLQSSNKQGELYLTDVIALAVAEKITVASVQPFEQIETCGVNSFAELAMVEKRYQRYLIQKLQDSGVHVLDPERLDIRGHMDIAHDVKLDINVILEGTCQIEEFVEIGAHCYIKNSVIKKHAKILPYSIIEDAIIEPECTIGPFARLRPGTVLGPKVKIGNFVELKNANIASDTKINHLAYIGDATIGNHVNIGAGVITCNYDGANKHHTLIEDHVFVGSNTEIVAPVKIGSHATIGAGTTVLKDVPANSLTLSKKIHTTIANWLRPIKKNKDGEI